MKRYFLLGILTMLLSVFGSAQKVFMTGDSHVSGKIYPREVKRIVEEALPDVEFTHWGKAAAGFYTFNDTPAYMDSIYKAAPDILIVHLGTNGSYAKKFDADKTYNDIQIFYNNVKNHLPDCKVVFVSPFYNKNRQVISSAGKKKTYGPWQVNPKTRECADVMWDFAESHPDVYVVDNNADAGTVFLDRPGLIREDYVHLTIAGYELLGQQVAEKLLEMTELWNDEPDVPLILAP